LDLNAFTVPVSLSMSALGLSAMVKLFTSDEPFTLPPDQRVAKSDSSFCRCSSFSRLVSFSGLPMTTRNILYALVAPPSALFACRERRGAAVVRVCPLLYLVRAC
jgi:hypothetical protein